MRVYHASIRQRLASLLKGGVDPSYSQGKLRASWFHSYELRGWAVLHVCKRHQCRLEDVVILECDVPDGDLKRSSSPGLYYSKELTSPRQIGPVIGWEEVARSPLEE